MTKEIALKKKKRLLKIAGICILTAAASIIFVVWYNVYSTHSPSYKENLNFIKQRVAYKVGKDPNELTKNDYEKVEDIRISGGLSDFRPLVKLKNLKKIRFIIVDGDMDMNLDFRPLAKLTKLRGISFRRMSVSRRPPPAPPKKWYDGILSLMQKIKPRPSQSKILDLAKFKKLKNLESLEIGFLDVNNLEVLASFPKMVRLDIRKQKINDLQLISGLVNLEYLNLRRTNITDINALANLTNLKELNISHTQVNDITPLSQLTNLESLNLFLTQVRDIKVLEGLTNLTFLSLERIKIKDITPLMKLTKLKILHLCIPQITDEQIAELQETLPDLKIYN
jgi:internalin A